MNTKTLILLLTLLILPSAFGLGKIYFISGTQNTGTANITNGTGIWLIGNQVSVSDIVCLANGTNCPVGSGNGSAGVDGRNGSSVYLVNWAHLLNGSLVLNFSNVSITGPVTHVVMTGNLTGQKGDTGATGATGNGVLNATVLANGSLQIGLTNGTILITGNTTGPTGPQGSTGPQGDQGPQGVQGIPGINGLNGTNGLNGSFVNGSDAYVRNLSATNLNVTNLYAVLVNFTTTAITEGLNKYYLPTRVLADVGNWSSDRQNYVNTTTLNNATICRTDGTNCPASSGGFQNGSDIMVNTLSVNTITNASVNTTSFFYFDDLWSTVSAPTLIEAWGFGSAAGWDGTDYNDTAYSLLSSNGLDFRIFNETGGIYLETTFNPGQSDITNYAEDWAIYFGTPGEIAIRRPSDDYLYFDANPTSITWNGENICLANGTNCPASGSGYASSAAGWTNTTTLISTTIPNVTTNNLTVNGILRAGSINFTSTEITEGTNLYFTTARVLAAVSNWSADRPNYINTTTLNNATICRSDGANCPASSGSFQNGSDITVRNLNATGTVNFNTTDTVNMINATVNTGPLNVYGNSAFSGTGAPAMIRRLTVGGTTSLQAGLNIFLKEDGGTCIEGCGPRFLFGVQNTSSGNVFLGSLGGGYLNSINGARSGFIRIQVRENESDTTANYAVYRATSTQTDIYTNMSVQGDINVTNHITQHGVAVRDMQTYSCDFTSTFATSTCLPEYLGAAIGTGGTGTTQTGNTTRPGVIGLSKGTAANSGYQYTTSLSAFRLNGSETFWMGAGNYVAAIANNKTVVRAGFLDSITNTAPTDGVYFEHTIGTSTINGSCIARTNTAQTMASITNYSLGFGQTSWYEHSIVIAQNGTQANCTIYNATTQLPVWSALLNSNIPTAPTRETGSGIVVYSTAASPAAANVMSIDYLLTEIERPTRRMGIV